MHLKIDDNVINNDEKNEDTNMFVNVDISCDLLIGKSAIPSNNSSCYYLKQWGLLIHL